MFNCYKKTQKLKVELKFLKILGMSCPLRVKGNSILGTQLLLKENKFE
jgi:hypothetical protein